MYNEKERVELLERADRKLAAAIADLQQSLNDNEKQKVIKAKKKTASECAASYNRILADNAYAKWDADGDNVVKMMIKIRSFDNALKVQCKQNKAEKWIVKPVHTEYLCDFFDAYDSLGDKIFHDSNWDKTMEDMINTICCVVDTRLTKNQAYSIADSNMVSQLQGVFDAIIPGFKASVGAYTFIREAMTAKGGIGEIISTNTSQFGKLVLEAMHVILYGDGFGFKNGNDADDE